MNIPYLLFEKITNKFSEDSIIGRGGFGDVYKGVLDNKELIAVKLLHAVQALDARPFNNEVANLFRVDHPNIVGLLGYCDEIHSKYVEHNGEKVWGKHICRVLCFQYFPSGSLQMNLYEQSFAPNWSTRYNIIKGICEDFGLSRLFSESHTHVTQKQIGTDKYMPPEYRNGGNISEKNDVFSLGVVMIDIMEGSEGYSLFHEVGRAQFKKEVISKWSSIIEPTSEYRSGQLRQVETCIDTAMSCVYFQRQSRPTIASILATLNNTETGTPSTQLAVMPPSRTIDIKNSLAETLKKMTANQDNITNSVANMEHVPKIREASSNVEEPSIIERIEHRETSSYVEEGLIIGRNEEKNKILSILSESSTKEMVILPIYGIGGIGKTTLAQLVYNDTQFNGYSRVWIYVSEKFDLKKIGNSIISLLRNQTSNIDNMEMLNKQLAMVLVGKSILIVLDDLWENDPAELDKLKAMLKLGHGSKVILVTTRDEEIARIICSTVNNVPYKLDILTNDMCWTIIKQKTRFERQADKRNLEQIGRDIAIKCGGVALAAQSIGYLLMSRCTSDQWESVRKSDIWYSEDASLGTHKVLASLRLSYCHMPRWLKSCFSYCGVFQKGQSIGKDDLIHQWIALGFPEPSEVFDPMQICEQYVIQLLGMSFLQYSNTQRDYFRRKYFTMHDLVHDLARAMLADKVNKNENVAGSSCEYALLTDPRMPLQSSLNSPENLKALHFLDYRTIKYGAISQPKSKIGDGSISPAKCLLVLDLRRCGILELPDSIGQLKQLRYLDAKCSMIPDCITKLSKLNYLSLRDSEIKALPDSIGDIKGLMHLDLYQCRSIRELPVSFTELKQLVHLNLSFCNLEQDNVFPEVIGKLAKLRYLMISDCGRSNIQSLLVAVSTLHNLEHLDMSESDKIVHIPECFGNLKNLQTLDLSHCCITELPSWMNKMVSLKIVDMTHYVLKMSKLECSRNLVLFEAIYPRVLQISELENVMSLEEAQSIELLVKRSVESLILEWTLDCDTKHVDDKDVLEKLVARKNIVGLHITGYRSLSFPTNWHMGIEHYLPNVDNITLKNLPNCNNLSPLGQLPNLTDLHLHRMDSLEELNTADSCGELIFSKLDKLHISSCPGLRVKPCLPRAVHRLHIEASDHMLISLAESVRQTSASPISLLYVLDVGKCTVPLHQWEFLQHVSILRELTITDCSNLASFSSPEVIQRLSSLDSLVLKDDILTELPTWLIELTSLQRLTISVSKLEKLNDSARQLTIELHELFLRGCGSMTSVPQWLGELTSLKIFRILDCKGIRSLPGSIRKLTELQTLQFESYNMYYAEIRKMFSTISADTDEVNIWEWRENYEKEIAKGRENLAHRQVNIWEWRENYEKEIAKGRENLAHRPLAAVRHTWTRRPKSDATASVGPVLVEESGRTRKTPLKLLPAASGATANSLDTSSADAAAVRDANAVALVPSLSALSIESGSATKNLSVPRFDAGSHSTQNMVRKSRGGARNSQTCRPRQLVPGASSSGPKMKNSATDALIATDEVHGKALVSSFSAFTIDSATRRVSGLPVDVTNTSTHENVARGNVAGVGHTSTPEIRQLLRAASATTTNSPDTSSGSGTNHSAADALIPTNVVATAAATDMDDLICSFSALSLDPGLATESS